MEKYYPKDYLGMLNRSQGNDSSFYAEYNKFCYMTGAFIDSACHTAGFRTETLHCRSFTDNCKFHFSHLQEQKSEARKTAFLLLKRIVWKTNMKLPS